ncbi:MAG: class I SAM-dependent methyltransferase [Terriglobia bacterium]
MNAPNRNHSEVNAGPFGARAHPGTRRRPSFRWSDVWKSPLHDLPIRDEVVYQYLPLSPEMEVLEIGPGSGFTAFRLSRRVQHLTLLDVAQGTIDRLRDKLGELTNLDFACADVCAPNLGDVIVRRFDAVYALEVFEYVPDPAKSLMNLAGLLKPGGNLLLNWPNYCTARTKGVNHIQTKADLDGLLRRAGFASWEVYALRLRPHARLIFRELHERPLGIYRGLRGHPDPRSAQTFDQTWTYQQGSKIEPYRYAVHLAWMLLFAGFRLGGDCFERIPVKEGSADGNLLLLAQR